MTIDKIKVVNKLDNVLVTVEKDDNNSVLITIKEKEAEVELSTIDPGQSFMIGDTEFIVLERDISRNSKNNTIADNTKVVSKKNIKHKLCFDTNSNNWKTSEIRQFLNSIYLDEIAEHVCLDDINKFSINLTSNDGHTDYGECMDSINILTHEEYKKYNGGKILPKTESGYWLATPDSTLSGTTDEYVCNVDEDGTLDYNSHDLTMGVRPVLVIKSSTLVSLPTD